MGKRPGPIAGNPALVFAGLLLGLLGQALLSPLFRKPLWALPFLALGLGLWLSGSTSTTLTPSTLPDLRRPFRCHWPLFVLAGILAGWGFFLFGNHRFTPLNTGVWLAATVLGGLALWGRDRKESNPLPRNRWWVVGVFACFALAVVFQFALLEEIPANPWSDHTEKLEDVHYLAEGNLAVFFPRNTGREPLQFYWTYLVGRLAGTGVSFFSLKLGTALFGLATTVLVFFLGRLLGGPSTGLLALFFYGTAFWPNILARIGLRFPLYPLFTAGFLLFFFRAVFQDRQRDWVLAGICLGLGLHGYTPFRVVPLLAVLLLAIFWFMNRREVAARWAAARLGVMAFMAMLVFLPLARFAWDRPDVFWYRAATRWASAERPVVGNPLVTFADNALRALAMFNWDDGELFAVSVPHRPALDTVTGALFLLGAVLALRHALLGRGFVELAVLASIVVLQLPSTLSLAFPNENPAPNRSGAAAVPAVLLAAWAGSVLWQASRALGVRGRRVAWGGLALLAFVCVLENGKLIVDYGSSNRANSFDTGAMARVVNAFLREGGSIERVFVVRVPHWVDTRLPALLAGIPHRDLGLDREQLRGVLAAKGPKLFLVKDDDVEAQEGLRSTAPEARWVQRQTDAPNTWFWEVRVDEQ